MLFETQYCGSKDIEIQRGLRVAKRPTPWLVKVDGKVVFKGSLGDSREEYNRLVAENKLGSLAFAL